MVTVHLVFTSCFVGWGKWTVYFFDCLPPLTTCLWISSGSPCPEWRKQPKLQVINNNMDSDYRRASLIEVGSFYHVNVKLVQTAKWCLGDGPKRENKANGGEGAFASRQAAHVIQVSLVSLTRLHLEEPTTSVLLTSHCFFQVSEQLKPNLVLYIVEGKLDSTY